jgi:hypothetical protein
MWSRVHSCTCCSGFYPVCATTRVDIGIIEAADFESYDRRHGAAKFDQRELRPWFALESAGCV